jgi:hypothetical protein
MQGFGIGFAFLKNKWKGLGIKFLKFQSPQFQKFDQFKSIKLKQTEGGKKIPNHCSSLLHQSLMSYLG